MEVLSGQQMRSIDRRAIEGLGIDGLLLMESAGRGVADALLRDYPGELRDGLLVICGKGNNGGDGLVVGRHLARRGLVPRLLLLAAAKELRGDAAANLRAARASGLQVAEITDATAWSAERAWLERGGLVLDAILGTGIKGGARGLAATVIRDLNASPARVVALDLPSGLDAESTDVPGEAVRAERTYTLCRPKLPLVLGSSAEYAGAWSVVPIGIPDEAVRAERPGIEWLDGTAARSMLPRREPDSHKGTYGHLLAVAGSRGKSGAAVLVGRAALRAGVGLVTLAVPSGCLDVVAAQQAELMTEPLPQGAAGALGRAAGTRGLRLLAGKDALAVGPGLGTAREAAVAVRTLLERRACPAVADADALNLLAAARTPAGPRRLGTSRHALVITPHPGEAGRLLGRSTAEVQADRLAAVRELAARTGAVVTLKGHRTLVGAPDGRVAVNATGNPGMATAGTGDVLTGVVGAFLARGLAAFDAARVAVFVHGDAGDRAAAEVGVEGMLAGDLLDRLPAALEGLRLATLAESG